MLLGLERGREEVQVVDHIADFRLVVLLGLGRGRESCAFAVWRRRYGLGVNLSIVVGAGLFVLDGGTIATEGLVAGSTEDGAGELSDLLLCRLGVGLGFVHGWDELSFQFALLVVPENGDTQFKETALLGFPFAFGGDTREDQPRERGTLLLVSREELLQIIVLLLQEKRE